MSTELAIHGVSHIEATKRHFPKDGAQVRQFTLVELTLHTREGIVRIKMFPGTKSATLQGLTITNEEEAHEPGEGTGTAEAGAEDHQGDR